MTKVVWAGIVVLVALAGWMVFANTPSPEESGTIRIGAVLSLTGIAASYGEPARNAMELAVEEINEGGGMDGRTIELIVEDDQTNPESGISAFRKLVDVSQVQGVVGGNFDFATIPLFPVAESVEIAFISPANLRTPGGVEPSGQSFVLMPNFSTVIKELAPYLEENETKKLAVVHFKSVFGQQIATTMSEVMNNLGRGPIIDEAYTSIGKEDFRTTILKLKSAGVDTVFLDMVDVDPVNFLTRSRELDFHPTVISYYGIIDSFEAHGIDNSLLEGVIVLDWESSTESFAEKYEQGYGVPPTHAAEKSYQAIYVMAEAIANTNTREEVAPYIEITSFETPSGTIRFNGEHALDSTLVKVHRVENGILVPLR